VVEHRRLVQGRRALRGGLQLTTGGTRAFYEAGYTEPDAAEADRLGRWRALGARSKAAHVRELCARAGLAPASLVEIGCGNGALLAQLRGLAPVMDGFELSELAAGLARREVPGARRVEPFDGRHVPAPDGEYELAILSHVLEHVPEPGPLLAEAARVARWVLVEVPLEANRSAARPAKRAEMAEIGHLHALSRPGVLRLLAGAGLRPAAELSDPLGPEHHAFFATGEGERRRARAKWAVRAAIHRLSPALARRLFTVHYAVLARA
jgi:SAM-dependent methyltransferase